ncbi:N-formylglutamate amidohydrolase [Gellertiella hungarica]|uniref:Putative N-formylglutamate amidohydrolase n=1 Tax=Gellertiella hungarica TaxID=1572859 RepID=A0A7W6J7B7_9HYPH|nr:N-formylglutamate amidohydrolase [Gellertiella hungarica]MBB4066148.1 putative N-formylglutamate amidohydrolase [Gellertiella hungarica]
MLGRALTPPPLPSPGEEAAERLQAVTVLNPEGTSPYVLLCEHASRHIPARYAGLGLPEADQSAHIAWDIGAKMMALAMAEALDAPLVMAGFSRLLIDLNRPLQSRSSIPVVSETTPIRGNENLTEAERDYRVRTYFQPFQEAVGALLDRRREKGVPTAVIGVHSFTPVFKGFSRPWASGVLCSHSLAFGQALVAALDRPDAPSAVNEPYVIETEEDYTVPVHGEARGLTAVLIEIRQDLIANREGALEWAGHCVRALRACQSLVVPPAGGA